MAKQGHFGLVGIHERVQHLNGRVQLASTPKHGTELSVTLPLTSINQPVETVRDPVCGALIAPQQAYGSVEHQGTRYYFCCPVCQGAFQRNPETYLINSN
jgi:YHS domain-containing protein